MHITLWLHSREANEAHKEHKIYSAFKGRPLSGSVIDPVGLSGARNVVLIMYTFPTGELLMRWIDLILPLHLQQSLVDIHILFFTPMADLEAIRSQPFLFSSLHKGLPPFVGGCLLFFLWVNLLVVS